MADSSFEEQVRKELEVLRLAPDARVWENVDAVLRKEKKHRWLVWFIILTGVAGSAGLYYQFDRTGRNETAAIHAPQAVPPSSTAITVPENKTINPGDKNNSTDKKGISQHQPAAVPGTTPGHVSLSGKSIGITTGGREAQPVSGSTMVRSNSPASMPAGKEPAIVNRSVTVTKGNTTDTISENAVNKSAADTKTELAATAPPIVTQADPASKHIPVTGEHTAAGKTQPVIEIKTDSVQTLDQAETKTVMAPVVKQNKNKWRLFGSMEIGRSGEIVSLASAPHALVADFASIGGGAAPPFNNTGGSAGNNITYKTPSRKGGYSFGLYMQALKNAGKKSSLGLSVGYSYYSSIVGVGSKVTAFANAFASNNTSYLSTDSIGYRNTYHFLWINGDYYLNFRLGPASSLRWRIGAGLGFLLASNVLHYNQNQRILYEDRSALSTLHTSLSTGLEWGVGKQQSFFIGPQLSYFLSGSSINGSSESNRHLFNASLRATIAIPKKKK